MKYIQIDIRGSRQAIEPTIAALLEIGITDAVVEDPADIADLLEKKNDYDWDYIDESILELENETPKVTVFVEENEEGRASLKKFVRRLPALRHAQKRVSSAKALTLAALIFQ